MLINKPFNITTRFPNGNVGVENGVRADYRYDIKSPLRRSARGPWRPPLPYSRYVSSDTDTYHLTARTSSGYWWQSDNQCPITEAAGAFDASGYYAETVPDFPSRGIEEMVRKARAKVKDQDVNLAVAFGERAATAAGVTDVVTTLTKTVRALRRRDYERAMRELGLRKRNRRGLPNEPSNAWLALQYGWLPLLSDVYGSCEALEKADENRDRYRCTVKAGYSDKEAVSRLFTEGVGTCYVEVNKQVTTAYKGMTRLDYVLRNPLLATMSQVGVTNPLEVAWELVPFSFVADWFVPVGKYLSDLDATIGWEFLGGSTSTKVEQSYNPVVRRVHVGSNEQWGITTKNSTYAYCNGGKGRAMRFNRIAYGPLDEPTASLPRISGDPLNGKRLMSAIALLQQAFR